MWLEMKCTATRCKEVWLVLVRARCACATEDEATKRVDGGGCGGWAGPAFYMMVPVFLYTSHHWPVIAGGGA